MAKNTGKQTESAFEYHWMRHGKRAYYFRIADAAEHFGRNGGKILNVRPSPSDYVVSFDGVTFYAEVKSTQNKTSFPFALLKKGQTAAAPQVVSAGGEYLIFVENLNTGAWYRIPYQLIQAVKDLGRSSIPWPELENFRWKPLCS